MSRRTNRLTAAGLLKLLGVTLFLIGWLVSNQAGLAATPVTAASQDESIVPSQATSAFVDRLACNDDAGASAVASPLYRAELRRRGMTAMEPAGGQDAIIAPQTPCNRTLEFEYVSGVRSVGGFSHLLYAVRPFGSDASKPVKHSVWRIDAAPDGRVIWFEMVWLFGPETAEVDLLANAADLNSSPLPTEAQGTGARPSAGIVSKQVGEGHYLLGVGNGTSESGKWSPKLVRSYTLDTDGKMRPGAWTFAYGDSESKPYSETKSVSKRLEVEPQYQALTDAYLKVVA